MYRGSRYACRLPHSGFSEQMLSGNNLAGHSRLAALVYLNHSHLLLVSSLQYVVLTVGYFSPDSASVACWKGFRISVHSYVALRHQMAHLSFH